MTTFLRANTAVDVLIGPFVEDGDGDTPVTGSTLDIELSKNGQGLANKNDATAPVHDAGGTVDGYYNCELDATDTNEEGSLILVAHHADSLPIRHEYMVMAEAAWDSMYSPNEDGLMDVNVSTITANAITATAIASNAITEAKIADNALTNAQFANACLTATEITGAAGCAVSSIGSGVITATAIAANAIGSSEMADGAITVGTLAGDCITSDKIANNALANEHFADACLTATEVTAVGSITGHTVQTGDSYAIVNGAHGLVSIQDDIDDILADTGELQINQGAWATATGFATAAELLKVPKSDSNVTWNPTALASIEAECEDALQAMNLQYLFGTTSVAADGDLTAYVANQSVMSHLMTPAADTSTYNASTDSQEAIRVRGDAEWATATGFNTTTPPTVAEIQAEMEENGASVIDTIRDDLANGTDGLGALKDLIDTMQGNVTDILTDTGTTLDNLVDDLESRLGTPSDFGSGTSTIAANLQDLADNGTATYNRATDSLQAIRDKQTDIETDTADLQTQIGTDGAGLTNLPAVTLANGAHGGAGATITLQSYTNFTGAGSSNPNMLLDVGVGTVNTQTSFTLESGSDDDDAYNDQAIVMYDASNSEYPSIRVVTDYVGSSRTITIDAAPDFVLVDTDSVKIFVTAPGSNAPTVGQIADAVWDEDQVDHTTADTFGVIASEIAALSSGSGLTALATGTAQSGTASTIVLASASTFADNILNGNIINIHTGTGAGQSRVILSNTLSDDTCNVTPNWTTNPSSDSEYEIIQGSTNEVAVSLTAQTANDNGADLSTLTGTDGAILATAQGNYAPAVAGDLMGLANDAITSAKYDESTAFPLGAVNGSTLTEAGGTGDHLTAIDLPNQTMNIIGTLSGSVGSVTDGVTLADNAITSAKYDESTAFPLTAVNGSTLTEAGGTGDHLTAINLPNQTMDIDGDLSGSVGSVTGAVGSVTGAVGSVTGAVGSVTAEVTADAVKISGSSDAADKLEESAETVVLGTAAGSPSSTVIPTNLTISVNDQYNGRILIFRSDTTTAALRGQATDITDTVTTSGTLTVTALTTAPSSGDTFVIV